MITRIVREAASAARLYGRLYVTGERSLTHLPADLILLARDHKLTILGVVADGAGVIVDLAVTAEWRARDAWVRAGRVWEEATGMPEHERMFNYRPGGMHLSTEFCPGECSASDAEPDDAERD